jgi:hypothetical protein
VYGPVGLVTILFGHCVKHHSHQKKPQLCKARSFTQLVFAVQFSHQPHDLNSLIIDKKMQLAAQQPTIRACRSQAFTVTRWANRHHGAACLLS